MGWWPGAEGAAGCSVPAGPRSIRPCSPQPERLQPRASPCSQTPPCLIPLAALQIEIDFKAECHGGDLVECLAGHCGEGGGGGHRLACRAGGRAGCRACTRTTCNAVCGAAGSCERVASVALTPAAPPALRPRAGTAEAVAANGAGPGALSFLHVLRRCEGEQCTELVRARTTWRAGEATA